MGQLVRAAVVSLVLILVLIVGSNPVQASAVQTCNASPGFYCYLNINLNGGDEVSGTFSITGSSGNDVIFKIFAPSGEIIDSGRVFGNHTFSFTAGSSGPYKFFFDNSVSTVSSKTVTLSYSIGSTLIPGVGQGGSYAIVIVILTLVLGIIFLVVRRVRRHKMPLETPPTGQTVQ